MKLTTEQIINMLPFDNLFRQKLLDTLPTLDIGTRYTIGKIIWKGYHVMYELKFQENLQKELNTGKMKSDGTLYERIELQTEQDMTQLQAKSQDNQVLSDVRNKIEQILNQKKQT